MADEQVNDTMDPRAQRYWVMSVHMPNHAGKICRKERRAPSDHILSAKQQQQLLLSTLSWRAMFRYRVRFTFEQYVDYRDAV